MQDALGLLDPRTADHPAAVTVAPALTQQALPQKLDMAVAQVGNAILTVMLALGCMSS